MPPTWAGSEPTPGWSASLSRRAQAGAQASRPSRPPSSRTSTPYSASAPEHGSFALALRRLETSAERLSREDRLIDCWIAFEALFAPDTKTELRFRASLRIARYLGSDGEERRAIAGGLRKAYDWRSHVVHGGDDPKPKELKRMGELDDAVSLCEQTLRRVLSKWLLAPADLREIDDLFLD